VEKPPPGPAGVSFWGTPGAVGDFPQVRCAHGRLSEHHILDLVRSVAVIRHCPDLHAESPPANFGVLPAMEIQEIKQLPLIDEDQIAMLVEAGEDGAADLIEELLDLFRSEAEPLLANVREAAASGVVKPAARPSHALAGSSANLGGMRLAKLSKAMELAADADERERFVALSAEVQALYDETVEAFGAEIAKLR